MKPCDKFVDKVVQKTSSAMIASESLWQNEVFADQFVVGSWYPTVPIYETVIDVLHHKLVVILCLW